MLLHSVWPRRISLRVQRRDKCLLLAERIEQIRLADNVKIAVIVQSHAFGVRSRGVQLAQPADEIAERRPLAVMQMGIGKRVYTGQFS